MIDDSRNDDFDDSMIIVVIIMTIVIIMKIDMIITLYNSALTSAGIPNISK